MAVLWQEHSQVITGAASWLLYPVPSAELWCIIPLWSWPPGPATAPICLGPSPSWKKYPILAYSSLVVDTQLFQQMGICQCWQVPGLRRPWWIPPGNTQDWVVRNRPVLLHGTCR